jgi:hypothetical protein
MLVAKERYATIRGGSAVLWVLGIGFFLILLFSFPRQMGVLIALVIAGGVLLYIHTERQAESRRKEQSLVETRASWNSVVCKSPTHPVLVLFANKNNKSTKEMRFSLQAHRPGFSKPVFDDYKSSDMIVAPGEVNGLCFAINSLFGSPPPSDAASLVWTARLNSVDYQSD